MPVSFLVLAQLPVSSAGWLLSALCTDGCDSSLHQSGKKVNYQILLTFRGLESPNSSNSRQASKEKSTSMPLFIIIVITE
jgi:hypothetical protein